MKKTKRLLTLFLALCLVLSMLSGCGKKGDEGSAQNSEATSGTVESNAADESGAETSNAQTEGESGETAGDSGATQEGQMQSEGIELISQMETVNGSLETVQVDDKYQTTYEVFVYSFYDSNGDGIGDLQGLISQLDYINDGDPETHTDLECTEIWLMPIHPSPTYHKYDVIDYMAIDESYGKMEDFETLVTLCHERGVKVIIDLVLNHTSTEHEWFQTAAGYLRTLPEGQDAVKEDCPYVWYYNFAMQQYDGYVPLENSTWYYEARFWSGMPDLNLETPEVRDEIAEIIRFWLEEENVDGFRLDAVTSYYTGNESSNIEFLSWLNDTVKSIKSDAYLVGECWTDQSTYARYYQSGIDSFFDFDFSQASGRIAGAVKGQKSAAWFAQQVADEEALYASYNENYVNAPFYTNHDTARSAGYYAYDDGTRTKVAGALNLLTTGNAFVYYGEELGMKGSGKDENKRAPMYWVSSEDAANEGISAELISQYEAGMTNGPADMDNVSMKFPSYLSQKDDAYSIFNYYRNAIRLRNAYPVIARGKTTALGTGDDSVGAMLRTDESGTYDSVLILFNLSEETKTMSLTEALPDYADYTSLGGVLVVSEEEVVLTSDGSLTLPAYSIAILTK